MRSTCFLTLVACSSPPQGSFRDCPDCPEMVVIPAGSFTMGSPPDDQAYAVGHGATPDSVSDEAPPHPVAVRSFALGVHDVTRGEYAAFTRETGHPTTAGCPVTGLPHTETQPSATWRDPGFAQTDDDPVVCVSWYDALAYAAWLSTKTHAAYRLPSEAEWEYAARGGTTTRFWWGGDDGPAGSDAWFKNNADGHTHPVGTRPANPFGLFDIVGDVWQWTADCYTESYAGAPNNSLPRAWVAGCMRVDRGGSWAFRSWLLRSATRERNPPDTRHAIMGLRVAKSLP